MKGSFLIRGTEISIYQEDIILNIYACNNRSSNYITQKLIEF